jgi:SPP1 family phage portal protein
MELLDLQTLLKNPDDLQKAIVAEKTPLVKAADIKKQYDPKQHDITSKTARPDKIVTTEQGISTVAVARIPLPLQKRIVRLAAAFLCGNPIELICTAGEGAEKDLLGVINKTWKDNKLDYKSKKIAKIMMSETEAAELWYTELAEPDFWKGTPNDKSSVKFKLRMKILSQSLGDELYPVFNNAGDMLLFARGYAITAAGVRTEYLDVYTAETNYFYKKDATGWAQAKAPEKNIIGKIPVIYYSQELPEWYDVQEMIDRLEKSLSNHADTNDYHGSPMIKVKGTVKGFAKKGESGKILELEEGADAEYMGWPLAPESVKMEQENLINQIYALTDTPNISFEQMKSLGTFSGIALKMLFLGAHLKAADHEENFGESIQRRINYVKAAMGIINVSMEKVIPLNIEPKFTYFLPKNDLELIELLSTASGERSLSQKTAVQLNPLVHDADAELIQIKAEDAEKNAGDPANL